MRAVAVVVWRNKRRAVVQVMPYSNAVNTPLSNFEANLNYKDATDPSVVVTFPVVSDPGTGGAGCSTLWLWRARVRCVSDVCLCRLCCRAEPCGVDDDAMDAADEPSAVRASGHGLRGDPRREDEAGEGFAVRARVRVEGGG